MEPVAAFSSREAYFEALCEAIELLIRIRRASPSHHFLTPAIEALESELNVETLAIDYRLFLQAQENKDAETSA
jgi:hypothetical protein